MNIRNIFPISWKKQKITSHPILGRDIEVAFEIGERKFYQFKEIAKMPAKRWGEFLLKFDEMRMGVTREWLLKHHCKEGKAAMVVKDTMDIGKIASLFNELEARLIYSHSDDSVYTCASYVFFEIDENLIQYDFIKNRQKIEFWKKSEENVDFFFRKPIADLIGFTGLSKEDIRNFLEEMRIARALILSQFLATSKQS